MVFVRFKEYPQSVMRTKFVSYQTLSHFGYKIREARKLKGWQPSELAHTVNITERELLKIESGGADVSIVLAKAMAAALDVGITDLL